MTFNNGDQVPAYGNENPAEGGNIIVHPKDISLAELPAGSLFSYKGTIALKSEYRTDEGAIQAYIVGTGEMFWGGTDSINDLAALIVTPMPEIIEYSPCPVQGMDEKKYIEHIKKHCEEILTIDDSPEITFSVNEIKAALELYVSPIDQQGMDENLTKDPISQIHYLAMRYCDEEQRLVLADKLFRRSQGITKEGWVSEDDWPIQCSLDEQQCQQECEHKNEKNREGCPFASRMPYKKEFE